MSRSTIAMRSDERKIVPSTSKIATRCCAIGILSNPPRLADSRKYRRVRNSAITGGKKMACKARATEKCSGREEVKMSDGSMACYECHSALVLDPCLKRQEPTKDGGKPT